MLTFAALALSAALAAPLPDPGAAATAPAPSEAARALDQRRLALDQPAMWTLGAWAAGNFVAGGVGLATAEDPAWRAFHQANIAWNTVNVGISGLSLRKMRREVPGAGGLAAALDRERTMAIALALNAGLDVAYLTAGGWLWERGLRTDAPREVGWGQALVVQGGFLLLFDLTLLRLHGTRVQRDLQPTLSLGPDSGQLGLAARF